MKLIELIIILIIGSCCYVNSQDIVKVKNFENINNNIEKIKILQNGSYFKYYSNDIGFDLIENGNYNGLKINVFENGIITAEGLNFKFNNNESLLFSKEDTIYTYLINWSHDSKSIVKYKLTKSGLFKLAVSQGISSIQSNIFSICNNRIIVVSDESEGYGNTISFYSNNFDLITSYSPYKNGFSRLIHSNESLLVFQSSQSPNKFKLVTFSQLSNRVQTKLIFEMNDCIIKNILETNENSILLFEEIKQPFTKKLISINNHGNIIWDKVISTPISSNKLIVSNSSDRIILCTLNHILCLNTKDGELIWEIEYSDIGGSENYTSGQIVNSIPYSLFDNELIGIHINKVIRNYTVSTSDNYSNLFIFSWDGSFVQDIELSGSFSETGIYSYNNTLLFINNQIQITYEK